MTDISHMNLEEMKAHFVLHAISCNVVHGDSPDQVVVTFVQDGIILYAKAHSFRTSMALFVMHNGESYPRETARVLAKAWQELSKELEEQEKRNNFPYVAELPDSLPDTLHYLSKNKFRVMVRYEEEMTEVEIAGFRDKYALYKRAKGKDMTEALHEAWRKYQSLYINMR